MEKTILVIDDEPSICIVLKKMFEKAGYRVLTAENGIKGLKLFRENEVDLVVVDLIMPEKDGIETIQDIKAVAPDIHIIAISGGGMIKADLYLNLAEKVGAVTSFEKPVPMDGMLSCVADLLDETP